MLDVAGLPSKPSSKCRLSRADRPAVGAALRPLQREAATPPRKGGAGHDGGWRG